MCWIMRFFFQKDGQLTVVLSLRQSKKKLESTKAIAALHHTSNNKMDESKTDWFGFHSRTHRKQASRLEKQFVRGSYAN